MANKKGPFSELLDLADSVRAGLDTVEHLDQLKRELGIAREQHNALCTELVKAKQDLGAARLDASAIVERAEGQAASLIAAAEKQAKDLVDDATADVAERVAQAERTLAGIHADTEVARRVLSETQVEVSRTEGLLRTLQDELQSLRSRVATLTKLDGIAEA